MVYNKGNHKGNYKYTGNEEEHESRSRSRYTRGQELELCEVSDLLVFESRNLQREARWTRGFAGGGRELRTPQRFAQQALALER